VRAEFGSPEVRYQRNGQPSALRGLNGSASIAGNCLTITVSNPNLTEACAAEIALRGGVVKAISGVVLAAADVHAHNTWDSPNAVEPQPANVSAKGSIIAHVFPPASVTKFTIELA
jgi:alpha-N-arabinofuranosidase